MNWAPRTRGPWPVLGGWLLAVVMLALLGGGIADRLSPTSLEVPGSPSARAGAMLEREFGNSVPVTVLLQGPAAAIDRQGPRLAAAFRRESGVEVISPWGHAGGLAVLRPRPGAALIVAGFRRPDAAAMSEVVPTAQRLVSSNVRPPLRAHVGGVAAVAVALQRNALSATHDAELLVAPILVIVLLLVFRSPVAAAVPLLMGAATVLAGRGVLLLATYALPVNSLAVAIASMMGLALGVDYALLMVSRFRQERDSGAADDAALTIASRAAGRTIVFAGGTLAVAMIAAAFVAPGDLLASVAAGVVVSALLSVLLATTLMPALLRVLSPHLDRWRLPSPGAGGGLLDLAARMIARPWIAIPLILLPMLAVAAPAGALSMGPPDPRQLPRSDPTRLGFEALRREIGPGWVAPFEVIATARRGTITEGDRLDSISRWEDRVARDPAVEAVIGPASLRPAEGAIHRARLAYRAAPRRLAGAERGIASLRAGLDHAGEGVEALRSGLRSAAGGAATIAGRTGKAAAGAAALEAGLARANGGAGRLSAGLDRAVRGAARLVKGQARLSAGAGRLARGLRRLDEGLRGPLARLRSVAGRLRSWSGWIRSLRVPTEMAAQRIESAVAELEAMTVGRNDPRYDEVLGAAREASVGVSGSLTAAIVDIDEQLARSVDSLASMPAGLQRLADGVGRLRTGAARMATGARRSAQGGRALLRALDRLARGSHRLERGVTRARDGGSRLAGGLAAISSGAGRLAAGLSGGARRTGGLAAGLAAPQRPLRRYAVALHGYGSDYRELASRSPGAIESGYLMLTGLDGTLPGVREEVGDVLNINRGGRAVRMLIVPASGPSSAQTRRLDRRLRSELPALARASDTRVGIGEGAQALADYSEATMARIPWLVLALSAVATVMLVAVLRSLLLPLVAVALNLLTIAAAFGALQLLFTADLLAGPPYIDAISAAGVLTIMFVLSIDYEVFLLTRMRESWLRGGDHIAAIEHGLRHTAGVITGAAVIMSSVFLAFATADIASLQQFGAGLTFAVILDATVIRIVLLPAVMRALGPRVWWLPGWLDRHLPEIEHGEGCERPPLPATDLATRELEAVSHAEHHELLALLVELEAASARGDAAQVHSLARRARATAEPHFRYEQRALFPRLVDALGADRVERLHIDQDDAVEALSRIEALAERGRLQRPEAMEARLLARAASGSIAGCEAVCEEVGPQPPEVAERVLAARERVLGAGARREAV